MSGMIRNEDVAYVRENVRIDDVVNDYLPLKQAGGDQKKGLCPKIMLKITFRRLLTVKSQTNTTS